MPSSNAEIIGAQVTITADEMVDPLNLDYFFTVKNDKIVKLIIVKNKQKSAK